MSQGGAIVTSIMTARKRSGREPVVRDAKWIAELERQLMAREFGERMLVFARSTKVRFAKAYILDEFSVSQLVQDVIDDTFLGKVTWDPTRVDLAKHVMDTIFYRTRLRRKRSRQFPEVCLDAFEDDDPLQSEAAEQHDVHSAEQEALRREADERLAAYRELAAGDRELLLLIDSYRQRIIERADVLRFTGLSERQYDAARERFRRHTDRLPQHLSSKRRG